MSAHDSVDIAMALEKNKVLELSKPKVSKPYKPEITPIAIKPPIKPEKIEIPEKIKPPDKEEKDTSDPFNNSTEVKKQPTYTELLVQSIKESKKLVVWVNIDRPYIEDNLSDCIHYHTNEFPGVSDRGVVVGVPHNNNSIRVDIPANEVSLKKIQDAGNLNTTTDDTSYRPNIYPGGNPAYYRPSGGYFYGGGNCGSSG